MIRNGEGTLSTTLPTTLQTALQTTRSTALRLASLIVVALALVACTAEPAQPPDGTETPPAAGSPAAAPDDPAVALDIQHAGERERLTAALEAAGHSVTEDAATAQVLLADREVAGADRLALRSWAAVTHQRSDVMDISAEDVAAILSGEVTDWADLGGAPRPITPYVTAGDAALVAAAFGIAETSTAAVEVEHTAALLDRVEAEPGSFGLVSPPDLRPGVLALVVDGHDPYRDSAGESPLGVERWVRAGDADARVAVLQAVEWQETDDAFDPIGFVGTGEVLPVRCTYEQLAIRDDLGAMFDGVRESMQAADLVMSQLDAGLTDRLPPSPCVSTFAIHASTGAAQAMADAGIDVVSTATNHHMDCYGGCAPYDVHFDTIQALEDAGMLTFGSGENLDAAREPAIIERGGVTFAFLAYDAIARNWNQATATTPGTAPLGWDTLETLAEDVRQAKEQADHVIVGFSWSYTEYVTYPDDLQLEAARVIAENGGSLIVGNGPHIVQASEHIGDMLVMYALGNFVYDQDWSIPPGEDGLSNYETIDGVFLEVGFTKDRMIGYRTRPVVIRENHRPEFVDPAGEEGQRILQRLWRATDTLAGVPAP